jgi:hypothetical protein
MIAALAALAMLLASFSTMPRAYADDTLEALLARLSDQQRREYQVYRAARAQYEAALATYWARVEEKRALRRKKRADGELLVPDDYVLTFPPDYDGPKASPEVLRILEELSKKEEPTPILTVADALESAKSVYDFVPERISEREFKRRYAAEALALGLTKDQVVRVYALETGGQGTFDMQAGINPITGKGRAISTALGYAQLLHANSVNELVNHGQSFIERLQAGAKAPGVSAARAAALQHKARVVRKMLANARSVPNVWRDHMRFASTRNGIGIHALNVDADTGPWLQVVKLDGLRELAAKNGLSALSGAQIELMNLAGPMTGLEMMQPLAWDVPTSNFFSRRGYEVNSIVRKRTARELLLEIDRRMESGLQKPGSIEFAEVFDEIARAKSAANR